MFLIHILIADIFLLAANSFVLQNSQVSSSELRCLLCKDVHSVHDCTEHTEVAICDAANDEYCYMDVSLNGSVPVYNGGCRSRQLCHTFECTKNQNRNVICTKCCRGDFCNFYLCKENRRREVYPC